MPCPASSALRRGVISDIAADSVSVQLKPVLGCVGCQKLAEAGKGPGHCGIDLLGLTQSTQPIEVIVPIKSSSATVYHVGDSVDVELPVPNVDWLRLVFQVYGLPTAGLLLGAAIGAFGGEVLSVTLAFAGLALGLWVGRRTAYVPESVATLNRPAEQALRIVNRAV